MMISDLPSAVPYTATYYRFVNRKAVSQGDLNPVILMTLQGTLEASTMGVTHDLFIDSSILGVTPQYNDYFKIGSQFYQIMDIPLYRHGFVIDDYFQLKIKSITTPAGL